MTTVTGKQPLPEKERRGSSDDAGLTPEIDDPTAILFNRELSQLEFYRRVLEEAEDETQPLLERLKFLSIFSTNIDEFFMVRVSGLKETMEENVRELSPDGMTQAEQLSEIRKRLLPMVAEQARSLLDVIMPQLKSAGIEIVEHQTLGVTEKEALDAYFLKNVFPVLTPQGVDSGHPFPYVSNLSLNLALVVEPVPEMGVTQSLTGKPDPRFVRLKLPPQVARLVPVPGTDSTFVLLEDLISSNLDTLFPRMVAGKCYLFRVTRDGDVEIREDEANDLLRMMEKTLRRRRFGMPVRLEVSSSMPQEMVDYLIASVKLLPEDVYKIEGPLNVPDLMSLYKLDRPELKDEPYKPRTPEIIRRGDTLFDVIKRQDLLLHHPYASYSVVTDFIEQAAHDPHVVAIKMCLYRTGQNSPIPKALIEACENGKEVTALVELKARFDEENNIEWAKRLEESGVHVVYGLVGLKTHSKVSLVLRQEEDGLRRYVHVATGNYNPITSNFYTDLSLFTADEEIGADATELFNFLTGFSRQKEYRRLFVAPVNLRERMLRLIKREAEHAREGRPARIAVKINRLADTKIINALYEASRAGVRIDLIVRGICMLRPGVPGLSETITVRSIVGRFLEHSRVYYFANGGEEELYVGSADWMPRNFDRRVEVIAPVRDQRLRNYLKDVLLSAYLRDNAKARLLTPYGTYERIPIPSDGKRFDAQTYFINAGHNM
jgi:polyphosphate kinase